MTPAIRVRNLGKRYRIGVARQRGDSLREMLAGSVRALAPVAPERPPRQGVHLVAQRPEGDPLADHVLLREAARRDREVR